MGVKWTEDQQNVIDLRDHNILVAAAAGSGKTAVLVERIITRLTKDEYPLNVDELLIVTFTEAAASEMKERILKAIERALEQNPENEHLQLQSTLIHGAMITTIHSFCLSVIREHFHRINLDPIFRTAEEGELKLLKQDTVKQLLEQEYEKKSETFLDFIECVSPGKYDKNLEEMILGLYGFSRSNPQPEKWLDECVTMYDIESEEALEQSEAMQYLCRNMRYSLADVLKQIERAKKICQDTGGPLAYEAALIADEEQVTELQTLLVAIGEKTSEKSHLSLVSDIIRSWSWVMLSRKAKKESDEDKLELVKAIRDSYKSVFKKWKERIFFVPIERQLEELALCSDHIGELVRLVQTFAKMYQEEKRNRNIIDYNDMEQYALQILLEEKEGKLVPSEVAKDYQFKFAEIMIDEYQDSNLVQEAILTSVSKEQQGRYNIFRVGDVKQSIYRFRLSRPELFMEKFNTYQVGAQEGVEDSGKRRIDLSMNFRSREEVLDATNYIFYQIMKSALGDVEYDDKAALYCGASFPEMSEEELATTDNVAEVLLIDGKQIKEAEDMEYSSREVEAKVTAKRIQELVGNHNVYDRDLEAYRPAEYRDMVILTRAVSGWADVFYDELMEAGIPTSVPSKAGYFSSVEVALLLNYLRVIDNPKQDIPLAAVLHSVFGNLTSEEMAVIKARYKKDSFSTAVYQYANLKTKQEDTEQENTEREDIEQENINQDIQNKLRKCLTKIERLQQQVIYMGIHEILWEIYETTHYREYVYALPGGEQRLANVDMLLEKATAFEGTSYKGVFNFIRYIEQLQSYQIDQGEASITDELDNVVRIMSIHKSKGLEFPIVFVAGMGKLFNEMDTRKLVITHPDQGLAMDVISAKNRTKDKSLLKQVMKERIKIDNLGEELRVLYVAMTRAKEKLILVGKLQDVETSLAKIKRNVEPTIVEPLPLDYLELSSARTYLDWVLPSVYMKKEAPIKVKVIDVSDLEGEESQVEQEAIECDIHCNDDTNIEYREQLQQQMEFQYADSYKKDYPLKISVTELKRRKHILEAKDENELEREMIKKIESKKTEKKISERKVTQKIVPEFIEKQLQQKSGKKKEQKKGGAERGTAYHRFLELWDFSQEYSADCLEEVLENYIKKGQMTESMSAYIEEGVIEKFMNSDIAKRMKKAAEKNNLHKEQPFVFGIDAKQIYDCSKESPVDVKEENAQNDEMVLVQGIVDVYFEEDEEIVILDYKTDNVKIKKRLKELYSSQLDYYGQALEQLTGKKVKEKIIYSLKLQNYIVV